MKHLSIRTKITLWFTGALLAVVTLTYICIFSAGSRVIQKNIRDNLIETVENNVDEVEYYASMEDVGELNDVDIFIQYRSGFLEVDDDFLDSVNQIYTALYDSSRTMLYGENPVEKPCSGLSFEDRSVRTVKDAGVLYYVFDRELHGDGLDGLWLRGVAAETQGKEELSSVVVLSLTVLPLLVLAAVLGGSLIAKKALSPIQKISDTAAQISRGDDLRKRIRLDDGNDELHQLADQFNNMFARLEAAFEKEKQFTSDISHELRTPMAVIMAQCEYSMEADTVPEEYAESIRVICRQGKRMTSMINQMLDIERLEMRPENYPKETLDFSELVQSVCEDLALIREKEIRLSGDIENGIFYSGNRTLLSRALSNLILNAYRYGKENGHIAVSLKETDGQILLSVADDGIGIAAEDLPKIFDRFYRADSSRTENGTGLGLAITKDIVTFHNGRITVESEPGAGSTFSVIFQKN